MRLLDLKEEPLSDLRSYLTTELLNHRAERTRLEQRWIAEATDFWGEASLGADELPNTGFATLIVPLTAIAAEAIHARTMGMIRAMNELVLVQVPDKYDHLRSGLDKLFNHEFQHVIKFVERTESAILELEKHGTGVASIGYRSVKRNKVLTKDGKEIDVPFYIEKGTVVDSIPISDFLMPFASTDTHTALWCGNDFRINEREIRQAEATGWFYEGTAEKLLNHFATPSSEDDNVISHVRQLTNTEPVFPSEVKLQRLFLDFDILGDGDLTEIEVIFHDLSGIICHISYPEGRPYESGVYMPLENRWYGYGIAKQNHEFQVEVTTQHRQRIDNATIANMSMFKIKNSARAYIKDDEPIFPGKKFYVEDMDDIQPLMMGDVKASAYNNENQVVIYSQQRTGVNELTLGMPNVGTPGTASDSMARVQESNRKSDYSYNNTKAFLNNVAYRAAQSIIKHGVYDVRIYEFIPKGGEVQAFLRQQELLTQKFAFNISLAGAKNNKVLDRNTYTQLVGMHTQYVTSALDLIGQLGPELIPAAVEQVLTSSNLLYMQILTSFDVPNPEKLILSLDAIRQAAGPTAPPEQTAQPAIQGMGAPPASGPSSIMAPGANISVGGGPANMQLANPMLSLAG